MKKILVILEQEEEQQYVLERANALAEKLDCSIHVLIYGYQELSWVNDVFSMLENRKLKNKVTQHLEDWWKEYSKPYVGKKKITHEIVWSKYFVDSVLKHCSDRQYDFIVKKGHRSESILYTSSDWLLLRGSEIPTYLVVSKQADINASVLVALDLLASSEEKQALNLKLLSVASDYAKKTGSELHCCFSIAIPKLLENLGFIDVESRSQELGRLAKERAKALLDNYDVAASNLHIKVGTPWEVIKSEADSIKAGLIVVGSMGKTLVAGKFIGNTCEQVLHYSHKDVLVIHYNKSH
jgi:nucleotide-binding universal stress UspA family protein